MSTFQVKVVAIITPNEQWCWTHSKVSWNDVLICNRPATCKWLKFKEFVCFIKFDPDEKLMMIFSEQHSIQAIYRSISIEILIILNRNHTLSVEDVAFSRIDCLTCQYSTHSEAHSNSIRTVDIRVAFNSTIPYYCNCRP